MKSSLQTMKCLSDTLSPLSWMVAFLGITPLLVYVFRPSPGNFMVYLGAEYTGLLLVRLLDEPLFPRVYRGAPEAFFKLEERRIAAYTSEEKLACFDYMVRFPARRALYCALLSGVKIALPVAVIVFYWPHQCSNLIQFLKMIWFSLLATAYLYGAVFIENHAFISQKLAHFHRDYDWGEVFRQARIPFSKRDFEFQERISIFAMWIMMLSLQWIAIVSNPTQSPFSLALTPVLIGLGSLLLVSRVLYLDRDYFSGGLESLFNVLEHFQPDRIQPSLPLHSSPILARFEMIFNSMMDRLRNYEQELSRWIFAQTELSRYSALGEISALIVHDLSAPLHVIHFCTEQLREDPAKAQNPRYIEQLTANGARSLELIDSLRSYLKAPKRREAGVCFGEVYGNVVRLLETRFYLSDFKRVRFEVDETLSPLCFRMVKADLIHVLLNLLANSVENLLSNAIPEPTVILRLEEKAPDRVGLSIRDNGTGLDARRFEQLTGFVHLSGERGAAREGLGMRLVRRLVERTGGTLTVKDLPGQQKGTMFYLKLKLIDDQPSA